MLETTEGREFSFKKKVYFEKNQVVLRDYIEKRYKYLWIKSIFDITISALVILLVFSWLFPILFLLIKLDSRGPIFFMQRRVGFLGRSFLCIKFRTMYVNPEANILQAEENDPRITRLGKFLRKSNLDELPQFLNVLIGQMSIVGPRPHMHRDCENFSKVVETYKLRHLARPGITGLAQVKGYRGPAHDFDRIFKRYQWDAFYIRNANFWLDLRIIRKTMAQTIAFIFSKLFTTDRELVEVSAEATNLAASRA
jgi:putative colanic acid biosynthesis UDP-glucose lipid carrier transferase